MPVTETSESPRLQAGLSAVSAQIREGVASGPAPSGKIGQPEARDYGLLAVLGAVWGSSFLLIKLAVETTPPLTVATGRIAVGALALAAIVAVRGLDWPRTPRVWLLLAVMGMIGNILPFTLISWGEVHIDSGLAAILMSTVPLATMLLAPAFVRDEPVTAGKLIGVLVGIAGVVILIGPGALSGAGSGVLGEIAVIVAAVCYACNGLFARRLPAMPVEVISAGTLLCAALVGVPASLLVDQPWQVEPSASSLAALICLGLVNTAGGYLLLFRLTMRAGAGFGSFNNFLVPLFGLMWGMLLLDERASPSSLLGLLLIFAGLGAVRLWPKGLGVRGR
jgi:drug/metabolite transporter (DMT)-like permease